MEVCCKNFKRNGSQHLDQAPWTGKDDKGATSKFNYKQWCFVHTWSAAGAESEIVKFAKTCCFSEEDVKCWVSHIINARENRKRGAQRVERPEPEESNRRLNLACWVRWSFYPMRRRLITFFFVFVFKFIVSVLTTLYMYSKNPWLRTSSQVSLNRFLHKW